MARTEAEIQEELTDQVAQQIMANWLTLTQDAGPRVDDLLEMTMQLMQRIVHRYKNEGQGEGAMNPRTETKALLCAFYYAARGEALPGALGEITEMALAARLDAQSKERGH